MDMPTSNSANMYFSVDSKVCLEALDRYKQCLDSQNTPTEKLNKFKCMDTLYASQQNCDARTLKYFKIGYLRNKHFSQRLDTLEIDYLNFKAVNSKLFTQEDRNFINNSQLNKNY